SWTNDSIQALAGPVTIASTGETHQFAATQIHHTIMGREEAILREVSLKEYKSKSKDEYNPAVTMITHDGPTDVNKVDLWNEFERPNHKWGMTIDMTTCIGCAACV